MMQIYFLSVLSCLVVGFMLAFETQASEIKYLTDKTVKLAIGIVAAVVGILKLFIVSKVPVFGDLLPVVAGIGGGFTLLLEYYLKNSSDGKLKIKEDSIIQKIFIINKKTVGYVCLVVAVIHFLAPTVLFL